MRWVEAKPEHLAEIDVQRAQRVTEPVLREVAWDSAVGELLPYYGRTLVDDAEVPIAVLGAWPMGDRAQAWAVLSEKALARGVHLVRGAHRFMAALVKRDGFAALEATVDPRHGAALAWLRKLGFVRVPGEDYAPDGSVLWRYEKVS